jgi:protein tyrosine/serine phosphatase
MALRGRIGWCISLASMLLAGCGAQMAPSGGFLDAAGPGMAQALSRHNAAKAAPTDIVRFAKVDNALYRGGLPSDADLQGLVSMGIKTDIDLMDPTSAAEAPFVAHEQQVAQKLGLKFINLALPWGVAVPQAMVDTFLSTVEDAGSQTVYVHCHHGRDRTGTMVAVYRIQHYAYTNQQALSEMETFGYNPTTYPWWTSFVLAYHPTPAALAR